MLGMDHRCSPLTLFLRMQGKLPDGDPDNDAMKAGRYYERATAEWACDEYGMKIVEGFEQKTLEHGPLSGHPDFLAIDEDGKLVILEVKNPFWSYKGDDWGESGTDEVPKPYFLQSLVYCHLFRKWIGENQHGMEIDAIALEPGQVSSSLPAAFFRPLADDPSPAVALREVADYAYVIAKLGGGICRYKIPFDQAIVSRVEADAQTFIARVLNDDPPTPQDEQDMRNLWPVTEGKVADCNSAFVEQLKTLDSIKKQIKALTEQESALKTLILGFAQDAERIEWVKDDGTRIPVCSLGTNRSLDVEALTADHPALLESFAKLDTTALRKADKALAESYMRKPTDPTKATRVVRLKLPKEEK